MAPNINILLSFRLRKLSESGASQEELEETMQFFLNKEREQKMASEESEGHFTQPLFARERPYLSVV